VEFKQLFTPGSNKSGCHEAPFVAVVTDRIRRPEKGIEVENFRFVNSLTEKTAQATIPSPTMMHFRGGRDAIDSKAYPEMEQLFADLASIYRDEISDLGLRQVADTCSSTIRTWPICATSRCANRPGNVARMWTHCHRQYAQLINESIKGRPTTWPYAYICAAATPRAAGLPMAVMSPSPRPCSTSWTWTDSSSNTTTSGPATSNRCVTYRPAKKIVLGLVSSKWPELEDKDMLKRRIDAASKFVPLEQLCLSPQCGFASVSEGNEITLDVEKRKLELVVQVAEEVWN
jgi:5-methyltetrahydropteroyltriglutamate--homocysteine methyltransferase